MSEISLEQVAKYRFKDGTLEMKTEDIGWVVVPNFFGINWEKVCVEMRKWIYSNGYEVLYSNPLFFALPETFDPLRGKFCDNFLMSSSEEEYEPEKKKYCVPKEQHKSSKGTTAPTAPPHPDEVDLVIFCVNGTKSAPSWFFEGGNLMFGSEIMQLEAVYKCFDGVSRYTSIASLKSKEGTQIDRTPMLFRLAHTIVHEEQRLRALGYRVAKEIVVDSEFPHILFERIDYAGQQIQLQKIPLIYLPHKMENMLTAIKEGAIIQFGNVNTFSTSDIEGYYQEVRFFNDLEAFKTFKTLLNFWQKKSSAPTHQTIGYVRLMEELNIFQSMRNFILSDRNDGRGVVGNAPQAIHDVRSFLESQQDSIETLLMNEFHHPSLTEVLGNFKMLKKLHIKMDDYDQQFPLMQHLESLEFDATDLLSLPDFNDKFPNLKELIIDRFIGNLSEGGCFEGMKNLKSITFNLGYFYGAFTNINAKKLILDYCEFHDCRMNLNDVSELSFKNCKAVVTDFPLTIHYILRNIDMDSSDVRDFIDFGHDFKLICNQLITDLDSNYTRYP